MPWQMVNREYQQFISLSAWERRLNVETLMFVVLIDNVKMLKMLRGIFYAHTVSESQKLVKLRKCRLCRSQEGKEMFKFWIIDITPA